LTNGGSIDVAIQRLLVALAKAFEIYESAGDGGRTAAILSLNAVNDLINAIDGPTADNLTLPLAMLSAALADLDRGVVARMLEPKQSSGGRPVATNARDMVKGASAAVMSMLVSIGYSRIESAKSVKAELSRKGFSLGGRQELTWRSVAAWRDQMVQATKGDAELLKQIEYTPENEASWLDNVFKITHNQGAAAVYRLMMARHTAWSEGELGQLSEPDRKRLRGHFLDALSKTIARILISK
jgi:hypothetical protein